MSLNGSKAGDTNLLQVSQLMDLAVINWETV